MNDLFEGHSIEPLARFGFTHSFWSINIDIIYYTWIALGILFALAFLFQYSLKKKKPLVSFSFISYVSMFRDLCFQSLGHHSMLFCSFILTIFTFILFCNMASLLPFIEEPTSDINTTFALGITSFLFIQFNSIRLRGLWGYVKEFCSPFVFMAPLNIVGELASVLSMSMRLFGNIFGGMIISKLWLSAIGGRIALEIVGVFIGLNILIMLAFGIFESVIQAFVFSILSLTYLSLAVHTEHEGEAQ
jgi:F-type H+-transporting ATPase subunit a